MNRVKLGNTDLFVTPVGMGVLTIGPTQLNLPVEDGARIVRHALESGINFLDTAEFYETYPYIKRALDELAPSLSNGSLSYPVIASKSLSETYEGMSKAIDECRKEISVDVIDIFLMHEVRESPDLELRSGAWECLQDAKAKGIVRAIGISTHHICAAAQAISMPGIDILFPLINFRGLGIRKANGIGFKEEMEDVIRIAAEQGIGVFAMKAFGGGNLLGEYTKALDYVSNLPGITSTMIGMGSCKDIDDAIAYFENRLSYDFIPDIADKRMFVDRGDCEGCGACVLRCTSKAIRLDDEGIATIDQNSCVLCGYCAQACPTRALILL